MTEIRDEIPTSERMSPREMKRHNETVALIEDRTYHVAENLKHKLRSASDGISRQKIIEEYSKALVELRNKAGDRTLQQGLKTLVEQYCDTVENLLNYIRDHIDERSGTNEQQYVDSLFRLVKTIQDGGFKIFPPSRKI